MKILPILNSYFVRYKLQNNNKGVVIKQGFNAEFIENIIFKGTCYVGPNAYWSAKGGIEIGNNVIFGPRSIIWTYNHNYMSSEFIPYGGEDILGKVIIEDNVWIGINSIILPNVTVGEGAIIGANTVVTKNVPKLAIVGGNPFRIIKYRDKDLYYKLKSEKKFYLNYKYNI